MIARSFQLSQSSHLKECVRKIIHGAWGELIWGRSTVCAKYPHCRDGVIIERNQSWGWWNPSAETHLKVLIHLNGYQGQRYNYQCPYSWA